MMNVNIVQAEKHGIHHIHALAFYMKAMASRCLNNCCKKFLHNFGNGAISIIIDKMTNYIIYIYI